MIQMYEQQVLSVHEAADVLGVSMQRVRQLIHGGQLAARRSSAGWLIPQGAVAGRAKNLHRGRPVDPQTAWSAIGLLAAVSLASRSGPDSPASAAHVVGDRKLRHRVLRMLAAMPDPVADEAPWRRLLSSRGQVRRLWAHPGLLDRLAADPDVSRGGAGAAALAGDGLAGGANRLELYVRAADADPLIRRFRMRDDPDGQVVLVVVPASVPPELVPIRARPVPAPAAVADLLEEDDPRARRAAIDHLQSLHRALHAARWLDRITVVPADIQSAVRHVADQSISSGNRAAKSPAMSGEAAGRRDMQKPERSNAADKSGVSESAKRGGDDEARAADVTADQNAVASSKLRRRTTRADRTATSDRVAAQAAS